MVDNEKTGLSTWSELLESMDDISDTASDLADKEDITNQPIDTSAAAPTGDDLLDELNKLFTPILIMQGYENDIEDKVKESLSESTMLTEKTIMKFDPSTRMAQLLSVCSLLIAKKKNTEEWQMFQKASTISRNMKIAIQKKEYDEAKNLAQKYLVNVSTSNMNSVARKAANELLPETQH